MSHVILLRARLGIPHAHSLKDKRSVIRSLRDRMKNRHNVAVAETEYHNSHNTCELSIVTVSSDLAYAEGLIQKIIKMAESHPDAVLECVSTERL